MSLLRLGVAETASDLRDDDVLRWCTGGVRAEHEASM